MSSSGLGKPPFIDPTPLDTSPNPNNNSGFTRSVTSSPLISKYSKRRIKKLGNKRNLKHGNKGLGIERTGSKVSVTSNGATNSSAGGAKSNGTKDHKKFQRHRKKQNDVNPIYVKDTEEYKLHLIRKIFLPKISLESDVKDYLPSLTSSSVVDIELYCFIGLLFKNFVNGWYFKITENDEFISEVIDVVSHVTRELEHRVKKIDLNDLILDNIPYILDKHRSFYNYCLKNIDSQFIQADTMDEAFDELNNHPALSLKFQQKLGSSGRRSPFVDDNDGFIDETLYSDDIDPISQTEEFNRLESNYLSILSKGALALLLPLDISESHLANYFIRSVMSNIVLKILTKQLSEPDIIYKILIVIFENIDKNKKSQNEGVSDPDSDLSADGVVNSQSKDIAVSEYLPKTIKGKIVSFFRAISVTVSYLTSSASSKGSKRFEKIKPPITDRYIFQFINNLFKFSIENPILYIFLKYFSLWFLSYNVYEINSVTRLKDSFQNKQRTKSTSSNMSTSSGTGAGANNKFLSTKFIQKSISTIINSHLISIKINKMIYNLFNKLVVENFFKNEYFIASLVKMARNMIFPTDNQMGPPRKIPNEEELEEMKIQLFKLMQKNVPYAFKLLVFNDMSTQEDSKDEYSEGESGNQFESNIGSIEIRGGSKGMDNDESSENLNDLLLHSTESEDENDEFSSEHKYPKLRQFVKTRTDLKFYRFIESFKHPKFNKLLVYYLTDYIFLEIFPELKDLTPSVLEKHD